MTSVSLSSYSDDTYVSQISDAGASGYLVKQTAGSELLKAIREVQKGNAYFSPAVAKRLSDHCREALANDEAGKRKPDYLTTREAEVLQLIAEGRANKQIAAELCISIKTVETHRATAMRKLGMRSTAALVRYAVRTKLVEA